MLRLVKHLSILLVVMLAFSCATLIRSSIQENDKEIPIGFGKEKVTILAVRKYKNYTKWLEKLFPENYFGNYIIINPEELESKKYSDTKKYRYIFDETEKIKENVVTATNSGAPDLYTSFSLTDRSTGAVYKTNFIYGAPAALMRDYLIRLEQVRAKNSGK